MFGMFQVHMIPCDHSLIGFSFSFTENQAQFCQGNNSIGLVPLVSGTATSLGYFTLPGTVAPSSSSMPSIQGLPLICYPPCLLHSALYCTM